MNEPSDAIRIALRIPGLWSHPQELIERLPAGFHVTPEALALPDGTEVEFNALKADEQFAQIFRNSCRQPSPLRWAGGRRWKYPLAAGRSPRVLRSV